MKELFFQCELFKHNKNFEGIIEIASKILDSALLEALNAEVIQRDYSKVINAVIFVTQRMPGTRYQNTAFSEAYCILGKIFETGILTKQNIKKAHEYYTVAADHSNPFGCYRLAHFYEFGIGCTRNMHKAAHFYKLSANGGCCRGMHRYGLLLLEGRGGCKRDVKGAVFYLEQSRKLASANYPHMFYDLGICYEKIAKMSKDIIEDTEYALSIYLEGDSFGCPRSSVRLGHAYNYGELGLSQDSKKAVYYYMRAESMSGDARFELYKIYQAQNNQQEAMKWLRMSAILGHVQGLKLYADSLCQENGGSSNKIEAHWWYIIAKTKGAKVDREIQRCKY
ncbi:uncharacterized protein NEIRO03_1937 [Nematocida sp. AWRm78]|nr:uncharacterized protein NEIRO02_1965 [Nematocida sp. AWRm79]KAI5185159.1 uncharacterized protein NEIRO03_1937 [Nematocida sp. AWRm78]